MRPTDHLNQRCRTRVHDDLLADEAQAGPAHDDLLAEEAQAEILQLRQELAAMATGYALAEFD